MKKSTIIFCSILASSMSGLAVAGCPTSPQTSMDLGSGNDYTGCEFPQATEIRIGSGNTLTNAQLNNVTTIYIYGADNVFSGAVLKGTSLTDGTKTMSNCTSEIKPMYDRDGNNIGTMCDTCPSTTKQSWNSASFKGTSTNYIPSDGLSLSVIETETGCYSYNE
ncbi:MAG: hypothetical protein QNK11_02700 [Legionella sp.]|nr:hypothetical protein [Legionella sp.]